VVNRYVGNLAPMPGVFPDRAAGDQYPQHVFAALARLAEAGEPLLGPVQ